MGLKYKDELILNANRQLDNYTHWEKKAFEPYLQYRGETILISWKDTIHSLPGTVRNPNS